MGNFIHTLTQTAIMSLHYLPPVKPSAIALGTFFNHGVELAVLSPLFGATYQRAKSANTKEEFVRSKEASSAAVAWGTTLVGSALPASSSRPSARGGPSTPSVSASSPSSSRPSVSR